MSHCGCLWSPHITRPEWGIGKRANVVIFHRVGNPFSNDLRNYQSIVLVETIHLKPYLQKLSPNFEYKVQTF